MDIYTTPNWTALTIYNKNDFVTNGGYAYYSKERHTSTSSFSTDLANGNWDGQIIVNGQSKPYFFWRVSYGYGFSIKPNVKNIQFGDNYAQTLPDGISNTMLPLDTQFNDRDLAEYSAILHFLNARGGHEKFYFFDLTTGNSLVNMFVMRDKTDFDTSYNLISGYFNEYSCSYSIGNMVEINANVVFLRDAGKIGTGSLPLQAAQQLSTISSSNVDITGTLLIPFSNSVIVAVTEFGTNRLQSFNLNIQANKVPVYNMGSKFPKKVELIYPINVELNFSFEVGLYDLPRLRNFTQSGIVRNATIVIADYSTSQIIHRYRFNNTNLISENYGAEVNGNVTVNQSYQTKIYN